MYVIYTCSYKCCIQYSWNKCCYIDTSCYTCCIAGVSNLELQIKTCRCLVRVEFQYELSTEVRQCPVSEVCRSLVRVEVQYVSKFSAGTNNSGPRIDP